MNNLCLFMLRPAMVLALAMVLPATLQAEPDRHDSHRNSDGHKSQKSDRRYDSYRSTYGAKRSLSPGQRIDRLPHGHENLRVGKQRYYYSHGTFYRPASGGYYSVVRAPLGARIGYLPAGYLSFYIGTRHYMYGNFTYYLWDQPRAEYVVVEEPQGAERAVVAASQSAPAELFVYPNRGQTEEQREFDRYQCYLWASDQTGYDPGAEAPRAGDSGDYRRAISACLEGRGYTVK